MKNRYYVLRAALGALLVLSSGAVPERGLAGQRGGARRLRCSVSPRVRAAAGGQAAITAAVANAAGGETVQATMLRPDGTATVLDLEPGKQAGEFSGILTIPQNSGPGRQSYRVDVVVRLKGARPVEASCGTVRVLPMAGPLPLTIAVCRVRPRFLLPAGGEVRLEASVFGGKGGISAAAILSTPGQSPQQVPLARAQGGLFRGTFNAPANTGDEARVCDVRIVATDRTNAQAEAGCGILTVGTPTSAGGIITGPAMGAPHQRSFRADNLLPLASFLAFDAAFQGGVTVAGGDVNGDGKVDLLAGAASSSPPHVKVFNGPDLAPLHSFLAYAPRFTGGVFVAAGDINGDGRADIVTGGGPGVPGGHVKVFDGRTGSEYSSFFAFDPAFLGGVRVAVGDVNRDGRPDIIAGAGPGGRPVVKVFSAGTPRVLHSFLAFDPGFPGGIHVAAGDVNGDGRADVITGPGTGVPPQVQLFKDGAGCIFGIEPGGPGEVRVFDGFTEEELARFFAFATRFVEGLTLASGDVNGDGKWDVIAGTSSGAPALVSITDGTSNTIMRSFAPYNAAYGGGLFVASWR